MGEVEETMCVVCVSVTEGYSGDGCDLASTLCKYDLRKSDLFRVLSWAKVGRVRQGSISSGLLMCGIGERSILLLRVAKFLDTIYVYIYIYIYIWRMIVLMSVVVTVWSLWNVCCVAAVVKDSVLALEC